MTMRRFLSGSRGYSYCVASPGLCVSSSAGGVADVLFSLTVCTLTSILLIGQVLETWDIGSNATPASVYVLGIALHNG